MTEARWTPDATPTHDDPAAFLADAPTQLIIGGRHRESASGRRFDVVDPATGHTIATVADATAEDGLAALTAAERAQRDLSRTPARERAEVLRRAFHLLHERREQFAMLMVLEMGKPLRLSQ